MKKISVTLLLALSLVVQFSAIAQAPAVKITPAERKIAEGVTAKQLSDYLHFVASDEMEGRNTPSRGLDTTARFIAMNLSRWGFKPAGDNGTFFQYIDLSSTKVSSTATTASLNGQPLVWGTDFLANPTVGTIASAPVVFGGNGWFVKSKDMDPLKGQDVKGKVVAIFAEGLPRGISSFQQLRALGQPGVDYMDPVSYAAQNGAAGVIYLAAPNVITGWDRTRRSREAGGTLAVDKFRSAGAAATIPVVTFSAKATEALLAGSGADVAALTKAYQSTEPMPAVSVKNTVSFSVAAEPVRAKTQNVVAVWEGSDPVLKNEMVAIGAHYDHVGNSPETGCRPVNGDTTCNGADDDGSGTVAVLSIAEALAKAQSRPKRSVLFVWHCGEEKGLWGSQYFNKFPTVDIKNVIAQLNIDMIGRSKKEGNTEPRDKDLSGENAIYVIGKDMMSSTLGSIVDATNANYLKLGYDTRYDDPKDTNRFFFRSDHFNYAVNGIPIAFWFDGVHVDYHQPGDEPDKIDYEKMEKVTRTIMLTLLKLAELKERPKVDKQLPAELTQR